MPNATPTFNFGKLLDAFGLGRDRRGVDGADARAGTDGTAVPEPTPDGAALASQDADEKLVAEGAEAARVAASVAPNVASGVASHVVFTTGHLGASPQSASAGDRSGKRVGVRHGLPGKRESCNCTGTVSRVRR